MTKSPCAYCGRCDNHSGNNTVCGGQTKLYGLLEKSEFVDYVKAEKLFPELRLVTEKKIPNRKKGDF